MNKNFKVFQIHGLTGLLFIGILLAGLFCGFILFPIWIIQTVWNGMVGTMSFGPMINYYQATLLWIFIVLCFYLFVRNSISIKVQNGEDADDEFVSKIIEEEKNSEG